MIFGKKTIGFMAAALLTLSAVCAQSRIPAVNVQFGSSGRIFAFHADDNDTAAELVRNITNEGRNLPIYHYSGFSGSDVMQYYDIPARYKIPTAPAAVTAEKAGEVYLAAGNRLMLFFADAQVKGSFTKVGRFDDSASFRDAVKNNPVLEGWGNKLILVRYADAK